MHLHAVPHNRAQHASKMQRRTRSTEHEMTASSSVEIADLVVAAAADAVIFADPGGVIRLWNPAAAALFGFSSEEAIGANLDLIIPERLRDAHWTGYRRAMQTGATRLLGRPTVTRALRKTGEKLYVEMSFAVVRDAAGVVCGSVAVARDATAAYEKAREARTDTKPA
jgi:PAS domain S-box-containing protein